ncbi:MAG: peptidoglycan DD-metalloendopeptidase family protein [Betaproteobacteria bacterium]|nr:peptidoglycan DD-metalloendopeptidase family protein [Betaproteobacteria bacterium]
MAGEPDDTREREPGILADRPDESAGRRAAARPSRWLLVAIAALGLTGVAAFGLAPGTAVDPVPTTLTVRDLELPRFEDAAGDLADAPYWREERVRRGDTIGELLARAGVDDADLRALVRTDPAARLLYQLKPGQAVRVATDAEGALVELRFSPAASQMLTIRRDRDGLHASRGDADVETRVALKSGVVASSLFGAADAIGLPDAITLALADAFSGDIDFYHDLRRGDRFAVVYETLHVDGEPAGTGRILAAEFENRGKVLRAFRWTAPDGTEGYYTEDGRNARKAFLRSPMEFSRVTSGFTLARMHPILNTWRAHRGVDYGAPTGTPIRATASGVVAFAGRQGGYGNVVILRHGGSYSTLYAHLSRFAKGVVTGARVGQGDTIGHVGQTGWATGPHLHYEFRVGDEPRNPLTVAMPSAEAVPAAQRGAFAAAIAPVAEELAVARRFPHAVLASAN